MSTLPSLCVMIQTFHRSRYILIYCKLVQRSRTFEKLHVSKALYNYCALPFIPFSVSFLSNEELPTPTSNPWVFQPIVNPFAPNKRRSWLWNLNCLDVCNWLVRTDIINPLWREVVFGFNLLSRLFAVTLTNSDESSFSSWTLFCHICQLCVKSLSELRN